MRVAVVGGGVAGLAAAWEICADPGVSVTLFEPGRIGGKVRTSIFAGRAVDEGPDAFLVRTPEATQLCAEIGLEDLVAPAAGRTLLWARGRLRPLPDGMVLGVPGRLAPVVRSGLLSPVGLARAALDLVLPSDRPEGDVSVGRLVAGRFGRQVATRLVEPLLGGIHAAALDDLSAEITAPQLLAAARSSRSLLLGLRAQGANGAGPGAGSPAPPIFLAPMGGMGRMVEELEKALRRAGVEFRTESVENVAVRQEPVQTVPVKRVLAEPAPAPVGDSAGSPTPDPDPPVELSTTAGPDRFDGVVLAVPAPVAARLLGPVAPRRLESVPFTSVALLTVSLPAGRWAPPAGFNGFLVPHDEGRLTTACSFFTNKWPPTAGAGDHVLRISAGHSADHRVDRMDDETLTARLVEELGQATGAPAHGAETRLSRWPGAFPLYRPGHGAEVARMEEELAARAPRVTLAGSSYGGAGIRACIRSGRAAARSLLERLRAGS